MVLASRRQNAETAIPACVLARRHWDNVEVAHPADVEAGAQGAGTPCMGDKVCKPNAREPVVMKWVVMTRRAKPPLATKPETLTPLMFCVVLVKTLVANIKGPIQKWVPKSKH